MKHSQTILAAALLLGSLMPTKAWAICMSEDTVAMDAFLATITAAEDAFRNVEEVEFMRLSGEVHNTVECVDEGFSLKQAARVHRLMAMRCFASGDIPCTEAEFRAARERDADHSFEQMGLGMGHPLQAHFNQAESVERGAKLTPVVSGGGHHLVDGVEGAVWYQGLPAILQHYCVPAGADEAILCETTYLRAGQDLPAWAVAPELPPPPVVQRSDGFWTKPWFYYAASGTLAAAAGGTYLASNSARSTYQDPSTPTGDLAGLESRTNGLGTTSVVLAGAAGAVLVPAITIQFGKKGNTSDSALSYNP